MRHEIVHNTYVVNDLKAKGAIFIEELSDVPPGATLVFSAHGVSKAVQREAEARGFQIFDATCPLVSKVHIEVAKLAKEGYEFIMIGHKGHPEVEGTMGQLDCGIHLVEDVADVATVQPSPDREAGGGDADHAQRWTTRPASWRRSRRAFRRCASPSNKTSATPRRTGRTPSSCSARRWTSSSWSAARPAPTATACARWRKSSAPRAYMVDNADELKAEWFEEQNRVGLTAGRLGAGNPGATGDRPHQGLLGAVSVRKMDGIEETVKFPLPKGLKA